MVIQTIIKDRDISIDLVKLVAMFMVMTLHSPIATGFSAIISAEVYASAIAIPLFFMVSGYLIINKTGGYKYSFHKIIGIVKFVGILSLSYYLVEALIIGKKFSLEDIVLAIVNPYIQKGIFSIFWYLGAMIIIYLLFPLISRIRSNYGIRGLVAIVLCLFVTEAFIFPFNIISHFEKDYIIQSLRVWNWLFYFSVGALIRYLINRLYSFHYIWMLLLVGSYIIFAYFLSPRVGAWEYLYASPMCMLYSILTFIFLIKLKITNKYFCRVIQFFSKLFLPVYALHIIILINLRYFTNLDANTYLSIGLVSFKQELCLISFYFITLSLSWIIMRIPGMNKVFRI